LRFGLLALAWLYLAVLLVTTLLRYTLGDRSEWLFTLNGLALYTFLPLPFLLPLALLLRRRELWLGLAVGVGIWFYLWGGLFLPRMPFGDDATGPRLTLMAYNLAGSEDTEAVLQAIRDGGADVVALQELDTRSARAIADGLSAEYPYQVLDGRAGANGSGVISRFPMRATGESIFDEEWVSPPTIVEVNVEGRIITLVRFHCVAFPRNYEARNRQADKLADYASNRQGPLVMVGDLNATSTNSAHAAVTSALNDTWQEVGWGFGHTFPGAGESVLPGSARPVYFGVTSPKWLVRIDYVFHSSEWQAISARTGPWDGRSDHRAMVAVLQLKR
jgi:endonuclease/exonuclease/phosphatase (EEP) superfamily protein YafD